ncbi:MAG: DUF1553 domain-containing protein, partial [Planctomycetaceae bacterium]|nr:DUF1553 domain-containing protein [Planctomycetaceae bacterium]
SLADSALMQSDQTNELLTRHPRRRLNAEALRDSMLQASRTLDLSPAEGSLIRHRDILVNLAGNLHEPTRHRSVYLCYLRNSPPPELAAFNLPEFTSVTGKRDQSTVPGQALYLYNNPFVIQQAEEIAADLLSGEGTPGQFVELAYQQILGRNPRPEERKRADTYLKQTQTELKDEVRVWASFCQALLMTNEFRYVD